MCVRQVNIHAICCRKTIVLSRVVDFKLRKLVSNTREKVFSPVKCPRSMILRSKCLDSVEARAAETANLKDLCKLAFRSRARI